MAKDKNLPPFAPMPLAWLADHNLSRNDLVVGCAIAFHDRFSLYAKAVGRGCFATNLKLAEETGLHRTVISRSISNLSARGYIRVERGRAGPEARKTIRVIYPDVPWLSSTGATLQDEQSDTGATQNAKGCGTGANQDAPLCDNPENQHIEIANENGPEESLIENNLLIHSSEEARPRNAIAAIAGKIHSIEDDDDIARLLIVIEREAKRDPSIIDSTIYRLLEHTATETKNISIRGHADRLLETFSPDVSDENLLPSGSNDDPFECPF